MSPWDILSLGTTGETELQLCVAQQVARGFDLHKEAVLQKPVY